MKKNDEKTLLNASPSMWRNRPIRFVLLVGLILVGVYLYYQLEALNTKWSLGIPAWALPNPGLIVAGISGLRLLAWWINSISTKLVVTSKKVMRSTGLIARQVIQIRHGNIQNVYFKQSIFQRLMGCGVVGFSSSGEADIEIVVNGIRNPSQIVSQIQSILDRDGQA